jgi:uncharacterized protein YbjT (DUF2867 family)
MSQPAERDTIFIAGGTGTQGSYAIRALLDLSSTANPISIHALVRDPHSSNSQALAQLSPAVKLFKGDYDNPSAIAAAAESCTACFFTLLTDWNDAAAERRQAQNILSALKATPTIKRVVYTTVANLKDPSVPGNFVNVEKGSLRYTYFEGKLANEISVRETAEQNAWAWTILRPATFLSNFLNPMAKLLYPQLGEHQIVTVLPTDYEHYFVDPADIGRFAAVALLGPGEGSNLPDLSSQTIDLASQVGLLEDAAAAMERAIRKQGKIVKIIVKHVTAEEAAKRGIHVVKIQSEQFLIANPVAVDLDRLKRFGIELGTVDGFFGREVGRLGEVLGL